ERLPQPLAYADRGGFALDMRSSAHHDGRHARRERGRLRLLGSERPVQDQERRTLTVDDPLRLGGRRYGFDAIPIIGEDLTVPRTPAPVPTRPRVARRLPVTGQRLAEPRPKPRRAAILRVIRDNGYVQLDPTNVVARNPYLVLWSRVGNYDHAILDDLVEKHGALYETPSLVLPVSDLPMHAALMHEFRRDTARHGWGPNGKGGWAEVAANWLSKN